MAIADKATAIVHRWMERKDLKLAHAKTEALAMTRRRKKCPMTFNVADQEITPSDTVNYLGANFDHNLSYTAHIRSQGGL